MDGHTEPLIAVIGDPIAGNPSQLAIELALQALDLEYRVTSFQVAPRNVAAAIDGLQVLGFRGVLVDDSLSFDVGDWVASRDAASRAETSAGTNDDAAQNANDSISKKTLPINCLFRSTPSDGLFSAIDAHGRWLTSETTAFFQQRELSIEHCLWLGNRNKRFPVDLVDLEKIELSTRAPSVDSVSAANLIVLSPGPKGEVPLDINEWPDDDGSTLIIDLTDGNEEICNATDKGYRVVSCLDRQIGTLVESFQRWTGATPSTTIIRDAIEEYLSV